MKNALATTAISAILTVGTIAAASAMPVAAPAAAPVAATAADASVLLVGHRNRDFGRHHHHILPRHVIVRSLHQHGFRHIRDVRMRHGDYVVHARGHRGPVRLVVDGRTARIVSLEPLGGGWHRPGLSFQGGNDSFSYFLGIR
ncbi:MAG: hypothetical protein Kow0026_19050 [Oricola sp.]